LSKFILFNHGKRSWDNPLENTVHFREALLATVKGGLSILEGQPNNIVVVVFVCGFCLFAR
jgi:uncharacterized membrane protein